jgi:hypothetical protein
LGDIKTAPLHFRLKLKDISAHLEVHWNRIRCIWQVFYPSVAMNRPEVVLNVMNEMDVYAPLDDRTIQALKRADAHARGRDVMDELEQESLDRDEEVERDRQREEQDYRKFELEPALKHDLNTEVSYPKVEVSIGARNTSKEDLREAIENKPERYRFGSGTAPRRQVMAATGDPGLDFDIEVEI